MDVRSWWMVGIVGISVLGSCGGDSGNTPAECPVELSYTATAEPFVSKYCVTCHSESVTGSARNGAPEDVNFGDEADLFAHGTHITEYVSDKMMPPSFALQPTTAERDAFVAWTKCSGVSTSHEH